MLDKNLNTNSKFGSKNLNTSGSLLQKDSLMMDSVQISSIDQ